MLSWWRTRCRGTMRASAGGAIWWCCFDNKSLNGTYVNRQRIVERVLTHMDEIWFGSKCRVIYRDDTKLGRKEQPEHVPPNSGTHPQHGQDPRGDGAGGQQHDDDRPTRRRRRPRTRCRRSPRRRPRTTW
jgi:hypothetical protein